MVVDLLKAAFTAKYGSVEDGAVVKITGQTDKPLSLLRHFKNERVPKVAITVDLLTTGVDIPPIVNLVFIRRVRSRILYEQMLGRATRLCEESGKEYFRVYDKDYLDAFKAFLLEFGSATPVLLLVTQRPRELTRKQLREIKLLLDEHGFSEAALQTVWRETTNQDIGASIIGFIRSMMLRSPLISYEEREQKAMRRILADRPWTDMQRIGGQIRQEGVADRESLDQGAFRTDGGFVRLDRILNGQLEPLLSRIHDYMWDDAV